MTLMLLAGALLLSTSMYLYLHKKTRMNLRFLYLDNLLVAIAAYGLTQLSYQQLLAQQPFPVNVISTTALLGGLVVGLGFALTMIRFWWTPRRKITAAGNEIVSPADGNVIYITRVEAGEVPVSIKGNRYSKLEELTKTGLLTQPCWLIGINMTPFDVHKNCAPVDGQVILNQHFRGSFLSLKNKDALVRNERNTYVIQSQKVKIGIVQIASRLVRRIDRYVEQGSLVQQGQWLGMIRFGSQVDVILPLECEIHLQLKDQIYAGTTVIASFNQVKK